MSDTVPAVEANAEAIQAWDGPLFERFVRFRHIVTTGLGDHGNAALEPGARLVMVVWRRREDNAWMYTAQGIVETLLGRPDTYSEPTCGPGPFSMAGADTVSDVLLHAGYEDIALHRVERPILVGSTVDEAVDLVMAIGPAGE